MLNWLQPGKREVDEDLQVASFTSVQLTEHVLLKDRYHYGVNTH